MAKSKEHQRRYYKGQPHMRYYTDQWENSQTCHYCHQSYMYLCDGFSALIHDDGCVVLDLEIKEQEEQEEVWMNKVNQLSLDEKEYELECRRVEVALQYGLHCDDDGSEIDDIIWEEDEAERIKAEAGIKIINGN